MKKLGTLVFGLVLLLALVGAVVLTGKNQDLRGKAYFAGSKLFLLPGEKTLKKDDVFPVQLWVETGNVTGSSEKAKVVAVTTRVCYDSTKLSVDESDLDKVIFVNKETSSFNEVPLSSVVPGNYPSGVNKCISLSITSNKPEKDLSFGVVNVAKLMFKAVASGTTGTIIIDKNKSVVSGNSTTTDTTMSIDSVEGLRYIIEGNGVPTVPVVSPTVSPIVTLAPTLPLRPTAPACGDTVVNGSNNPEEIDKEFEMGMSSGHFTFTWMLYAVPDRAQVYYENTLLYDVTDNNNEYKSEVINFGPGVSTKVRVKIIPDENAPLWYYKVGCPTSGHVEQAPTPPDDTSVPTLPMVAGEWPILKYKISYRDVDVNNKCIANWPVVVTALAPDGTIRIYSDQRPVLDTSVTDRAVYYGELVLVDFPYDQGIAVFFKGPKHLQAKYGVDNQTDYYTSAGGSLTLTSDPSEVLVHDFSGYPLMPGDVTGMSGSSDGVVDGLDYSYVKASANDRDAVDDNGYLPADMNGDCGVNSIDTALFKQTLKDKLEQLY